MLINNMKDDLERAAACSKLASFVPVKRRVHKDVNYNEL
jgi:hypothetical protein